MLKCVETYLFPDCDRRCILAENGSVHRPEERFGCHTWVEWDGQLQHCKHCSEISDKSKPWNNKKNPANAKGNARQRCMCEGPVRTKSKFINDVSFGLDGGWRLAPYPVHEFHYCAPRPMHEFQYWLKIAIFSTSFHLAPSIGVTLFEFMEKLYWFWN